MRMASKNRRQHLQSLKQHYYDLVIIGGGITGAGIALDAVSRGLKVALIEKQDFASGASSRSTKMIHGGLRYLQKLQLKTVAKTGRERAMLYENAPHVIMPEKMLLPIHKGGSLGRFTTSIGLKVYDYLAGVKQGEKRVMLSRQEVLEKVPAIKVDGLRGAGEYVEYRADDARLTLEIIKKASELGADCYNYLEAERFNCDAQGYVEGVLVKDGFSGNHYLVEGSIVLNATGAWMYDLMPVEAKEGLNVNLIKGAHIVFDQSVLPLKEIVYFDTGAEKNMVFAVPRGNKVYVGVSSAIYHGKRETPTVSETDIQYLLTALNEMFPALKLTKDQVESSWAGMTAVCKESTKSKGHKPLLQTADNGLMTVMAGKLTGYRELAESVVDEIAGRLKVTRGLEFSPCQTQTLRVSGADVGGSDQFPAFIERKIAEGIKANLTESEARALATMYGANVDDLFEIASTASPDEMQGLPLMLYVKLMYGLKHESVMTPADFWLRRTSDLYFNIEYMQAHHVNVTRFMARYFSWSAEAVKQFNSEVEVALYQATHPVEDAGVVKLSLKESGISNQDSQMPAERVEK